MGLLVDKKQKNNAENKLNKKNYVSQPSKQKEPLHVNIPHQESELKAAWCDEHVLDDFRW